LTSSGAVKAGENLGGRMIVYRAIRRCRPRGAIEDVFTKI
jgi:hypothetical protein